MTWAGPAKSRARFLFASVWRAGRPVARGSGAALLLGHGAVTLRFHIAVGFCRSRCRSTHLGDGPRPFCPLMDMLDVIADPPHLAPHVAADQHGIASVRKLEIELGHQQ